MPLNFRKVVKFGPIRLNFGRKGLSSWSTKIGRWSWNSRTRRQNVDLPGPFSWRSK
ncbi:MAG TPA: DUF4236 domain-containing protein [Planosporangium sp.]|jgi:hypothetical protein|nr:DUF4236 domain-containing protein [Planosporangium sp.]